MVASVSAPYALPAAASGTSTGRAPDLDAKLNTTRAQLEDWVTCASAKTPEGKAKIEQLTAKFEAIQQQIVAVKTRKDAQGGQADGASAASATDLARTGPASRRSAIDSPLGNRLDVYA